MDSDSICKSAYQYSLQDLCIVKSIETVWNKYWLDTQRIFEDGEIVQYQGRLLGDISIRHTLPARTNFRPVSRAWRYPVLIPLRCPRASFPYSEVGQTNSHASPLNKQSVKGTQQNILQSHTNHSSNPSSRTLVSGSEVDPIVISENNEVVSNEETPSNMIQAEVN
jgi:hypothetical protein